MPRLAHQVFFTLKNRDDAAVDELVAACHEFLNGHDGLIDFAVGRREPRYQRPVNADYDVALHTVFQDQASHDAYQTAPRHLTFIEQQKENWASVQVFDSNLTD
ncbi:Dabb family protein [Neorhodopirellula pilleata]|uniref:Stress responsive A/B Barrel Domain protein n=1 Tax=Neorhodopirellula pilleata TaxID=2714738 RepID=A0A5C6AVC6_9BACT|nr:Dabb family protein [Neorhodopirellula pilleata]TWU03975.1 Stress responsive A/B Barrel Domain protein [Neorhodopirellula pilleata]